MEDTSVFATVLLPVALAAIMFKLGPTLQLSVTMTGGLAPRPAVAEGG